VMIDEILSAISVKLGSIYFAISHSFVGWSLRVNR
jgi:hypothetical protein